MKKQLPTRCIVHTLWGRNIHRMRATIKTKIMVKIRILISIFILYSVHTHAQNMNCNEKIESQFINKIQNYNSKDLIPYYSEKDNKWGYFIRTSKKIVTKPIMNKPYFFKPNIEFYYSFETDGSENGCNGKILGSKDKFKIEWSQDASYQVFATDYSRKYEFKRKYSTLISDDISGFEVDSSGKLTKFNSKFYDVNKEVPTINQIIFFRNNYYAITEVIEDDKRFYSIINQDGKTFENFDKIEFYPMLKQRYTDDTDLWFLCETKNGKYIYKSLLNNLQLEDEIDDETVYGERQDQSFGYVIYTVNKKKGVFDLTTMKWKIKPSSKNDFIYLYYASSEPLLYSYKQEKGTYRTDVIISNKDIEENRKNSYIYIQTSKNHFYDLNLKLYKANN